MLKRPLTERQQEAYRWLTEYVEKNRDWPSFRTMQDQLGFSSVNSATQVMHSLVKKGYIVRHSHGAYDFAPEHVYLSPRAQRELMDFFDGVLDLWYRGAKLDGELRRQYQLTLRDILSRPD